MLPYWYDIDAWDDLLRLKDELGRLPLEDLPNTRRFFFQVRIIRARVMNSKRLPGLIALGGVSFLAGTVIAASVFALTRLPSLRGPDVPLFLAYFLMAALAYVAAILRLKRDALPIALVWLFAVLFRVFLLLTTPTLSDDVFRYIWDSHLLNLGISPYALPINSALLDQFTIPIRALVNNNWMASPYLPFAQIYFWFVNRIMPQNPLGFQIGALLLDLGTGGLVMDMLRRLGAPRRRVLVYLWNPLVILEFAHGAHIDSLMIFFILGAFWFILRGNPENSGGFKKLYLSALSLAAATLTKLIPILLVPVLIRRWKWPRLVLYLAILITMGAIFSLNAGLGLSGPLDGTGLFGAVRIYTRYWNFNSGLYHWLEVLISGYQTPGAVPVDIAGGAPGNLARSISGLGIILTAIIAGIWSWKLDDPQKFSFNQRNLFLLRVSLVPLGAFLFFTTTVHPWYVTLFVPFLPFLLPVQKETGAISRFIWPWVYFSCGVALAYTTYINLENLREYYLIRKLEYIPFYLLLLSAAWPYFRHWTTSIFERGILWARKKRT